MIASPETPATPSPVVAVSPSSAADFGRTAMAILVTMILLMVALTGILFETTWRHPAGEVEVHPPDPGSFAQR
ncbi:MAG TPA: hypothetical protein VFU40_04645 [Gemmatimonadales bacterium]|nr:hypothetical protein [Gemmatimonadales bacterium]